MLVSETRIKTLEINYRGILQKNLAKRIAADLVYIAHLEGQTAFSNNRYSDDPERDGVPAARYAYFGRNISEEDLEAVASYKMDIDQANVVVVLDDTMAKGVEPWAFYGIRPINEKVVEGGTVLFVSRREPKELVKELEKKPFSYNLAVLPGDASFSGLWYYRDDGTDVRVLGAVARVDPDIVKIEDVVEYVRKKYGEKKAELARKAYEEVIIYRVQPNEGKEWPYPKPKLPKWYEFSEGIIVKAVPNEFRPGPRGLARNPHFKRWTSRTQRPVVRFDLCTKCTLCWLDCPDEAFDPTPDGYYDVNYEYCVGCGRCAEICPVNECIVMVDELEFEDNESPYEKWKRDPKGYIEWVEQKKGKKRVLPEFVTGKGEHVSVVDKPVPPKKIGGQ